MKVIVVATISRKHDSEIAEKNVATYRNFMQIHRVGDLRCFRVITVEMVGA